MAGDDQQAVPRPPHTGDRGENHLRELARAKQIIARWSIDQPESGCGIAPGRVAKD